MRILLVGAGGFIGRHLLTALQAGGHEVVATSRSGRGAELPGVSWRALDLATLADDPKAFAWPEQVELLINAAGLLDTDAEHLDRVQHRGTRALFDLAAQWPVKVIHISALGAGSQRDVPFLASKAIADDHLLELGVPAVVLRPSLVLGQGSASSAWLGRLSVWPLAPLLDTRAQLQPLHIDDLVGAVLALLRHWPEESCVLPVVGGEPMTQAEIVQLLRRQQGRGRALTFALPGWLAAIGAFLGDTFGWRALNSQTRTLARRDNIASGEPLQDACGYRVAPLRARLHEWPDARSTASDALRPLLLATLLMVWLGTAYVCLGPGFNWGLSILAEAGVRGEGAAWLVRVGAVCDALLGLGLLSRRWRKPALRAQLALMLGYSLILTAILPYYWFDPFAALGKNLVLMVATLWLLWTEPGRGQMPR